MARRRRRRPLVSRLRAALRRLLAFLFTNVGVVLLVLGYTIAGAFVFQAIEGAEEMERALGMARERNATALRLWTNATLPLNNFNDSELARRINAELIQYQQKVVLARRRGWDGAGAGAGELRHWTFSSAFLYCLTVITTIGYGNLSPRTSWGKLTTIVYALLGMPLFLLYLSNVGELFASWFKWLYALVCLCRGCPGYHRRRVARLRAQITTEMGDHSEVYSLDGPDSHGGVYASDLQYSPCDTPTRYNHSQLRRFNYGRTVSEPYPREYRHHDEWYRRGSLNGYYCSDALRCGDNHMTQDRRSARGRSLPVDHYFRKDSSISSSDFTYVTFDAQTITVPISVCVVIMVGYVIFGSMLFGMWERWDQLDGAYFCFISLSSIGFGDFVPGERVYTPTIQTSFIACSMYLMLGMALVAMCFNLMQEQVIHYFAGMKRALRRVCRCLR